MNPKMMPMLNLKTKGLRRMKWLSVGLIIGAVVTAIFNMPYFTIPLAWVSGATGCVYILFSQFMKMVPNVEEIAKGMNTADILKGTPDGDEDKEASK